MSINDKIKQILIDKNLSPSYFADEIGVQRSSISHILSGRNRPSFDIIQKIIRRFPDLGYEWIMEEDTLSQGSSSFSQNYGNRPSAQSVNPSRPERYVSAPPPSSTYNSPPADARLQPQRSEILSASPELDDRSLHQPQANLSSSDVTAALAEKKIERILIFFTDGSFKEYSSVS